MLPILYWIYCLAFAFDFRGEAGGSSIQYLFLGVALVSGGLLVVYGRKALLNLPGIYLILIWGLFLALTPAVALAHGVPLGNYIRSALPLYLMGLSLLVMQVMAGYGFAPHRLIFPLVVSGCINILWRSVYALGVNRIPIGEIRYELLSSAAPLFIGYAVVALFFSQRRLPWDALFAGTLVFGSLFISITRSYIATAGLAFLASVALFYGSLRRRQWTVAALYAKIRRASGLGVVGTIVILAVAASNAEVVARWMNRLFENAGTGAETSADVSVLTRQAEAGAMFGALSENPHTYLFGLGLGASYQWDEAYLPELLLIWGDRDELNDATFAPGHSTWVYAIFSSGYFGLTCYLLLFLGGLAFSWRVIRKLSFAGRPPDEYLMLPVVVLWCYISQTFTANPFMDRFAGLIIGLFLMFPQVFLNRYRLAQHRPEPRTIDSGVNRLRPSPVS